jgi:hypothetical protein
MNPDIDIELEVLQRLYAERLYDLIRSWKLPKPKKNKKARTKEEWLRDVMMFMLIDGMGELDEDNAVSQACALCGIRLQVV